MQKFISFSGGVESTTMCVLFGDRAKAIWADTDWEHELMYQRINNVENSIRLIHPNFEVIRIKGKSLVNEIRKNKFFPSPSKRYCTRISKIEPIDEFLKSFGECELMIGLNYDESDLRSGNHGLAKNVTYTYPLVELGFNRSKCVDILNKVGLNPNFPPYMSRGGCKGCFFKSKKEFIAMALINEEEFDSVMNLENEIQDKRSRFFSILPSGRLSDIKIIAKSTLFEPKEMYPDLGFQSQCGVFCHR